MTKQESPSLSRGEQVNTPHFRSLAFGHPDLDAAGEPPGLQHGTGGALATVTDTESVRQSLLLLLTTRPGERVNRPDYGCRVFQLAFEPADQTTAGLAEYFVSRAIEMWEHRIDVLALHAEVSDDAPHVLQIGVAYRIRATGGTDELRLRMALDPSAPPAGAR